MAKAQLKQPIDHLKFLKPSCFYILRNLKEIREQKKQVSLMHAITLIRRSSNKDVSIILTVLAFVDLLNSFATD